nr:hypothetical protein [uncultured Massilia sp.]
MPIPELPAAPDPATDNPTDFNLKAAAYVLAQKAMVAQFNDALGQFNASLAGGAYALPYVFDAATTDADPGAGKLRLSSATQSAATVMRLDVMAGVSDVSGILDKFDASTSDVKGSIRLVKMGDPSKWLTFDVMSRTAPSGYRNLTVVNTGGSSASPFAAGDGVLLFFQRNGDVGTALSAMVLVAPAYTVPSGLSQIDFLNVFDSNLFAKYTIEFEGLSATAAITIQFAVGGVLDTATHYYSFSQDGASQSQSSNMSLMGGGASGALTATMEVRAASLPNVYKSIGLRGTTSGTPTYISREGHFNNNGVLSGFRMSAGLFTAGGVIRIYGHRKG